LKLADRQVTWQAMVFVADTLAYAGLTDKARDEYREIVDRADKDKQFAQAAATALTRVRVQLVSLLAKESKYDEAHKQVSQLVAANPKALEPLMEQGRILKAWAEKEPVHFKEAVAHWAKLRDMLKNAKTKDGKSKMPEYFEVVYYLAQCLYQEGKEAKEKSTQQEKAKQSEQLLKSTLVLSPNLSGPDMVAQYNALAQQAAVLQGRSPMPAGKPPATGVKPPAKPASAT
jgi:tetratricopeptide (TPR) repeat protein